MVSPGNSHEWVGVDTGTAPSWLRGLDPATSLSASFLPGDVSMAFLGQDWC